MPVQIESRKRKFRKKQWRATSEVDGQLMVTGWTTDSHEVDRDAKILDNEQLQVANYVTLAAIRAQRTEQMNADTEAKALVDKRRDEIADTYDKGRRDGFTDADGEIKQIERRHARALEAARQRDPSEIEAMLLNTLKATVTASEAMGSWHSEQMVALTAKLASGWFPDESGVFHLHNNIATIEMGGQPRFKFMINGEEQAKVKTVVEAAHKAGEFLDWKF